MNCDSIANFEFNNHSLLDGVCLITRLIRDDFSEEGVRRELEMLTAQARAWIPEALDADQRFEKLIELFYYTWGFGPASGVYSLSETLWLDEVLKTRRGAPSALGTLLIYFAEKLNIPLYPVMFPTQLLVKADWLDGDSWVVNPLNGETLTCHVLDIWLKGHLGINAKLTYNDLSDTEHSQIIIKLLGTLKNALMQENRPELALRANELALSFDPEDPYEIRDRGLIYAQLDCNHIAAQDLNYFIEQCPEDPVTEMIKIQLSNIEQTTSGNITLH